MKRLIYVLMAAAAVFAAGSCKQPVEPVQPEDTTVFEVDDLEAISAQAGTFTVGVTTNIPFTVEVPDDVAWLRYIETKAEEAPEVISAPVAKKSVVFEIDLNEEDAMRQARVKFLDDTGEQLKAITVIQKAGGGIEFEVEWAEDISVDGETIIVPVSSNVPFEARSEVDWITVKSVTASTAELEIASNGSVEPRDGTVNFYRAGTDKKIGFLDLHQMEPNVILNVAGEASGFGTVAEAMAAYNELAAGPAEIILARGTHAGVIAVAEGKPELTVNGNGVATLDGSIEINKVAVTVKDLAIASSGEGTAPQFTTAYNYKHGIFVHSAGYGVRIENVRIDMKNLDPDATGIFLLSEGDKGTKTDVVRNSTIDGGNGGHRLMQAYGAKANITGNTFLNPYSSYAVRFGDKDGTILLASNKFEGASGCAVHFNNLESTSVTLGNGTKDNNKFNGTFEASYKASTDVNAAAAANTFAPPVEYSAGVVTPIIDPNAPATLTRVWGYYNGSRGEWDDQIVSPRSNENWNRNGIISGDYVYVTICGSSDDKFGVAVFDLLTGEYIRTITTGFTKEGTFWTCGIVKMQGEEADVIYVCNMAMTNDSKTEDLVVYRLIEPDSEGVPTAAEVAMRYTVPNGERYGDKMTAWGSSNDGLLTFVSFYHDSSVKQYRSFVEFLLTADVINPEPHINATNANVIALAGKAGAQTGGIYLWASTTTEDNATRQGIYASNFDIRFVSAYWYSKFEGYYNFLTDKNHSWGEDPGSILTNVGYYDANALDPRLVFIDGIRYFVYTVVELDSASKSSGYLRMVRIPDATGNSGLPLFDVCWAVKDDASAFQRYPIGDPDDFSAVGHETTNKTGYCDVAYRGDDIYILSGVTSTGMSVFKVE
ncbi:MAG: hypothetical protein J6X77_01850 [Bacteroidales bacterium]|nr:hypothetical protein [Bacteroidales bacterium]